jgi:hypothetical protein
MHDDADVSKAFEKLELQKYEPPKDPESLRQTHVPFSGSACKHPYDPEKLVLVTDPFSTAITYCEVVNMVRFWVRKGCVGVRCTPFVVEDTRIR